MAYQRRKMGDILVSSGAVTAAQLEEALRKQAQQVGSRLGKVLVELGYVTEEQVATVLSEQLRLPRFQPGQADSSSHVQALLSRQFLEERQVFPVGEGRNSIRLAMADPLDYRTINEVQFLTGRSVEPLVATPTGIELLLKGRLGTTTDDVREALRRIQPVDGAIEVMDGEETTDEDILKLRQAGEAAPIVGMVNMILSEAVKADASDVHIEPRQANLMVRYRIDGLLRDMTTLPAYVHQSVISRIKIMARMDIAVRRRPQDGSTKIRMGEREIDLRISTLPTLYGEKMVIRILEKSKQIFRLEDLGMPFRELEIFRTFLSRPQGMVLVTGPTGSGKTTTLYAALQHVRSEGVNIITVEDPVEYQIPGINQVHVNVKAGITFATGLRSLLRQDPNIIMVGEIRDRETAEIAFQAALTGHLVLSTLHTNNAVAAVTRLMDIGVEPYLVASSVVGVVAQRLVRRTCPRCLAPYDPDPAALRVLGLAGRGDEFRRGEGCETCQFIGYRGRVGVYEILRVDDYIRELIIARASEKRILTAARAVGMKTMEEDGVRKALDRVTTLEELLRVLPPEEDSSRSRPRTAAAVESPGEPASPGETSPVLPASVVLAEGSPGSLGELAELLASEGVACSFARDVGGVLQVLGEAPGTLVISDLTLDDLDAGQLEKMLREDARSSASTVLAVAEGRKAQAFARKLGFDKDRTISRPFKAKAVRKKLEALAGQNVPRA